MFQGNARQEGKITIFQLRDDLTSERVKLFLKKMDELIASGQRFIILDLTYVEEVSLLGMVALSSLHNRCRTLKGSFKIAGLTPFVKRSFRRTNLINTIEVFDEVLDALRSFKSQNLLKSKSFAGSFYLKDLNSFVGWDRLPQTGQLN